MTQANARDRRNGSVRPDHADPVVGGVGHVQAALVQRHVEAGDGAGGADERGCSPWEDVIALLCILIAKPVVNPTIPAKPIRPQWGAEHATATASQSVRTSAGAAS